MNVRLLEAARRDIRDAMEYYEAQRDDLGAEFWDEVSKALNHIGAFPEAGRPLSAHIRRSRVNRFPYGVSYSVEQGEIVVIAVAHNRRAPEHWKDRLD